MILLTPELHDRLLANGRLRAADHVPVVKLFNPLGAASWLATELDEDGDTLFGLADLGFGCPELGSFSLSEMSAVRLPLGLGIERDLWFDFSHFGETGARMLSRKVGAEYCAMSSTGKDTVANAVR